MKVFIITTTADITSKDIQDFIWMNTEGEFALTVAEIAGAKTDKIIQV